MGKLIYATGKTGTIGNYLPEYVIPIRIDLKSKLDLFQSIPLSLEDVVVHLGAVVGIEKVQEISNESYLVNVVGTKNLGMISKQKNVKKFIYVSTAHVYKPGPEFLAENDKLEPLNEYAYQKYLGELELLSVFADSPEKLCIVRLFSILDWGMPDFSLGGAVKKIQSSSSKFNLVNGDDVRDFLTPKQVADILIEIAVNESAHGIINLCTGIPNKIIDAVPLMFDQESRTEIQSRISFGNSKIPRIVGDSSCIRKLLPNFDFKWNPQVQRTTH